MRGSSRSWSDLKRAFTLIELLVVIAIMGLMVTAGVVSVRSGQDAARIRGATRDIFAAIRHARSTALVTQQPAIVTYSTEMIDGEVSAKVEITSAKLMTEGVDPSKVRTLAGRPLKSVETVSAVAASGKSADVADPVGEGGDTLEEVLFAPIDANVVKGIRIKVVVGGGGLEGEETERRSSISVFSNVDYLLSKFKDTKKSAAAEKSEEEAKVADSGKAEAKDDDQEPVSVVWEESGRVEPHQVWVYADGKRPESGLSIKIDRFGAAKVVSADGSEDDD